MCVCERACPPKRETVFLCATIRWQFLGQSRKHRVVAVLPKTLTVNFMLSHFHPHITLTTNTRCNGMTNSTQPGPVAKCIPFWRKREASPTRSNFNGRLANWTHNTTSLDETFDRSAIEAVERCEAVERLHLLRTRSWCSTHYINCHQEQRTPLFSLALNSLLFHCRRWSQ